MALSDTPKFIGRVGLTLVYVRALLYLLGCIESLEVGLNFT